MASVVEFEKKENNFIHRDSLCFISRCPVDVLMCIFEAVVEIVDNGTKTAIILSHVCRAWRQVAISMPRLWDYLNIWCSTPMDAVQLHLEQIASRVKARPTQIVIREVNKGAEMTEILRELRLDRFPAIEYLILELHGEDSMHTHILNSEVGLFSHQIEGLEIFFMNQEQRNYPWNSSELLEHFPRVEKLSLVDPAGMRFCGHGPFTSIRVLEITKTRLDFIQLLRAFPQLESLELHNVELYEEGPAIRHIQLLENLTEIELDCVEYRDGGLTSCLSQVQCPQLLHLNVSRYHITDCLSFISSHRSLRTIGMCPSAYIENMATAAPDLEQLGISLLDDMYPRITLGGVASPIFPRLSTLTILMSSSNTFQLEEFELLVCVRCLPASHPRCKRPEYVASMRELEISFQGFQLEKDYAWVASPFYDEAKKTFEPYDAEANFSSITMSWI